MAIALDNLKRGHSRDFMLRATHRAAVRSEFANDRLTLRGSVANAKHERRWQRQSPTERDASAKPKRSLFRWLSAHEVKVTGETR